MRVLAVGAELDARQRFMSVGRRVAFIGRAVVQRDFEHGHGRVEVGAAAAERGDHQQREASHGCP